MNKLSAEILKITQFAQGFYFKKNNDAVINFLISLDLLVKGVLTHWQIKLSTTENTRGKGNEIMSGLDIKFPLLIGD